MREGRNARVEGSRQDRDRSRFGARHRSRHGGDRRRCRVLKVPVIYMDKIAVGLGFPEGLVDLDATPADNLKALAQAKGVPVSEITVCILDRPRHAKLIEEVRGAGAALRLIGDGDIAGVIHVTEPLETGIDIYMGVGGAPEG